MCFHRATSYIRRRPSAASAMRHPATGVAFVRSNANAIQLSSAASCTYAYVKGGRDYFRIWLTPDRTRLRASWSIDLTHTCACACVRACVGPSAIIISSSVVYKLGERCSVITSSVRPPGYGVRPSARLVQPLPYCCSLARSPSLSFLSLS